MVYEFRCRVVARLALVVQVSGGTLARKKQRHPANQDEIQIRGNNRVDTIFGAGLSPCSFFETAPRSIIAHLATLG
jgi:hypothetical protein